MTYDPETGVFVWNRSRGLAKAGQIAGHKNSLGYLTIRIDYVLYYAHRLAWFYVHGEWPDGDLDHIDEDKGNNRIANLRPATSSENKANVRKHRHNTSGYKGVCFHQGAGRWMAYIQHQGRLIYLGLHDTPRRAHLAYRRKAKELFGEYAAF